MVAMSYVASRKDIDDVVNVTVEPLVFENETENIIVLDVGMPYAVVVG